MATASTTALVEALRRYRLLESASLEEVTSLRGRLSDPKALAGELIRRGWLTAYQGYALVIFSFGLVGAFSILRGGSTDERQLLGVLAAISLSLAVIHALAYVEGRHRWGVEPLLLLLTARGIFVVAGSLRNAGLAGQLRLFRRESER